MEMADIVRYAGQGFIERSRRWINGQHEKVLTAITRCRTAALGGHRDRCSGCGQVPAIIGVQHRIRFNHTMRGLPATSQVGEADPLAAPYRSRHRHQVFRRGRHTPRITLEGNYLLQGLQTGANRDR